MVDWNSAQQLEERTWRDSIGASVAGVIQELADSSELERFLRAHRVRYRYAVEVGIGPMGVGWLGLFGLGEVANLVGLEPLERFQPVTGCNELDGFLVALQRRITYIRGRAEDDLLPKGHFDLVVCDNVIDHTEEPSRVLEACRQLVSRDGNLAFGVNVFSVAGRAKMDLWTRRRQPDNPSIIMHPHSFTERSATVLLQRSGWRIVSTRHSAPVRRALGRSYRWYALARLT